ncbi:MAG: hypothetical protein LC733_07620 [Actinobacteria bacterium]|nr:hypothetical protein [Actinomycetota bacterium]
MTATADERRLRPGRQQFSLAMAVLLTAPGLITRITGAHLEPGLGAFLFGLAIVGAAFLLSWAAEVAQLDLSAGLAIAILAFIAVLPEYAVDLVFAWKGGNAVEQFGPACQPRGATGESPCSLALANMTGANRLLIGIGWSMVVFIAWYQWRRRGQREDTITLERTHTVELSFLTVASLYSLTLPLKRTITLVDAALLVGLFVMYTIRVSRAPAEEPHLVGPAAYIGGRPGPSSESASSSSCSGSRPSLPRHLSSWSPVSMPGVSTPTPVWEPWFRPRSISGRSW